MIYAVTGRVWNAETRKHDKLQTVEFERRVDATGFMNLNQDWIAGMVMDRDAEAIAADKAEAAKLAPPLTVLGVRKIAEHRWQVTYDGKIMGDDRGYNTEAEALREVDTRLYIDQRDARHYNRPVLLTIANPIEIENGWKDVDGNSLLTDETDESGIPS